MSLPIRSYLSWILAAAFLGGCSSGGGSSSGNATAEPALSIRGVEVEERTGTDSTAVFAVTLSRPAEETITVWYRTVAGTAAAGQDFVAVEGQLVFAPGVTRRTVEVPVRDDLSDEDAESFSVALADPDGAVLDGAASEARATITDDDPEPVVSVASGALEEGAPALGSILLVLSAPSGRTVRVDYAVDGATARLGVDFQAEAGSLTFPPGAATAAIPVTVLDDDVAEPEETFRVRLLAATHAVLPQSVFDIAVVDDDESVAGLDERPANPDCVLLDRPANASGLTTRRAFPNLTVRATVLAQRPGDNSRWYAADRNNARVLWFENRRDVDRTRLAMIISDRVVTGGEGGLIGMTFHPEFDRNGQIFLAYTGPGEPMTTHLARFVSRDGGDTFDPASEEILLSIPQYGIFHKAGRLQFGPADGFLYMSAGDGSRKSTAQDLDTLHGAILRIDVDRGDPYAIPPDNPFAGGGGRGEIWAYGLRNPWGWSFDRATLEIWAGDVGDSDREEINRIVRGGNYGWPCREGTLEKDGCGGVDLVDPVFEFNHDFGNAVIGGYVYRGARFPELYGTYVFADYGSGRTWGLFAEAGGELSPRQIGDTGTKTFSFAEDQEGELLVVAADSQVHEFVRAGSIADNFPRRLSEVPCVDASDPARPGPGLIPYEINVPFWSDNAAKERFLAIPDGTTIRVEDDGDWSFPIGTVFVKVFRLGGRLIETRLLVRHGDGGWAGYSYEWNDDESDAVLLEDAKTKTVAGQEWTYPSRAQCLACHTASAGVALGPDTAQMNRLMRYAATGRTANQLETFAAIGLFAEPLPAAAAELPVLPDPRDPGVPLADRARAYLQANCSHCHRPDTGVGATMDFRFDTPFAEAGACDVPPAKDDLGIDGARIILPGDPSRSLVPVRMRAAGSVRMPPIGRNIVDAAGADLIEAWIAALEDCR